MSERRYTDDEVTRILRRATELEGRLPALPPGEGVNLTELREIAREVGIDAGAVSRAAAELDRPETQGAGSAVARVHRDVRVVPRIDREGTADLVRHVDRRVSAQGTVTEALGGVRWSGEAGLKSVQVAIHDTAEGTVISVEERYPKIPELLHILPAIWGTAFGAAAGEALAASMFVTTLVGLVLGVLLGHGIWRLIASGSAKRVRLLADELALAAVQARGREGGGDERDGGDGLEDLEG
ncbi:MAG TPA: hypothetical protein VGA70_13885 [Longimicrobiales bacterium]|jgi:hypothetical protein